MKFISFIKDMFTSNTGVSSKRVSGFIGWLSFILICAYCTIVNQQAPDAVEILAICSSGLLGLETITAIWSRKGAGLNRFDNNEYEPNRSQHVNNRRESKDESERECD